MQFWGGQRTFTEWFSKLSRNAFTQLCTCTVWCSPRKEKKYFLPPKVNLKSRNMAKLWPIKLFQPQLHFLCIFCARAAFVRVVGHKNAILPGAKDVASNWREGRRLGGWFENDGIPPQIQTYRLQSVQCLYSFYRIMWQNVTLNFYSARAQDGPQDMEIN